MKTFDELDGVELTPGQKRALTMKARYGDDYYSRIGRKGGAVSHEGGFSDLELARQAGQAAGYTNLQRYGKANLTNRMRRRAK